MDAFFELAVSTVFLALSLAAGVLILFALTKLFPLLFLGRKDLGFISEGNVAATLLLVAVIVSSALLTAETLLVIQQYLHHAASLAAEERLGFVLGVAGYGILQLLLSVALALGVAWVSVRTFDLLTKHVHELREIREHQNLAAGLLLGGFVIALTLFIQYPFSVLVPYLIPLPRLAPG